MTIQIPGMGDVFDLLSGGGTPSLKFTTKPDPNGPRFDLPVGTSFSGLLQKNLEKNQARDYDSGQPEFWNNDPSQPRMQLIAEILVPELVGTEGSEDTGVRAVYFKQSSALMRALQEAWKKVGNQLFGAGTRLTITFTGYKPAKNPQHNPQKLYEVTIGPEFVPPGQQEVQQTLADGQASVAAPAAQAPQQAYIPQPQVAAPAAPQVAAAAYTQAPMPVPQPTAPVAAAAPAQVVVAAPAATAVPGLDADALAAAVTSAQSVASVTNTPIDQAARLVSGQLAPGNDAVLQQILAAVAAQ